LARNEFYKLKENAKKIIPNAGFLEGSTGVEAREHNYRARILRGEYSKALAAIDLKRVRANNNYSMLVEYDLLKTLAKKDNTALECAEDHKANKKMMVVNYDHTICCNKEN